MGSIFELMINEARESLFQLESIATALDNKAYGLIAFNTIVLSVLAYFNEVYHNKLIYIPIFILVVSLILVLICIIPRASHRMTGEKILNRYGGMEFDDAAGHLAFNYAGLEKELSKTYNKKLKYLQYSLGCTIMAIFVGAIVLYYLIFDP